MPKYLRLFAMLFFLTACTTANSPAPDPQGEGKLHVVATTTIVADVVREIGGEHITLTTLLPYGADPHSYEPVPQDIFRVAEADIIFVNGAGLEAFLENMIESAEAGEKVVELSQGIALRSFDDDHEELEPGYHTGGGDPHTWTDPHNVVVWVDHIEQTLSASDPAHAQTFQANADKYKGELTQLDAWIQDQVARTPVEARKLVTDHMTFGYFSDRYGFEQIAAIIPGFSTLAEPSANQLAQIEGQIRTLQIKAIFVGYSTNPELARRIAEDTGAELVFLYTGSLSKPGGEADTYLQYMRYNTNAIVNALK